MATSTAVELPDGRRVSLECWPGDGAPLVLLHGLLDCAAGWKHLARMIDRPCYAFDLPGFGDSDCPTRNRISAYAEDVQTVLAALDVHHFTLVGHSLGGAVATALAERLGDDVAALVLIAPAGFGRIQLAEAIQLPGVRTLVRHGLPLALMNPVSAFGVYMAVVGNGHLPDPEVVARLRKNAHRWAPGAACANEAITASGRSRRAFYRRELEYRGPVLALWGERDRLVPRSPRRCNDRVPARAGQRLEEDGPPSPARTSERARTVHRSRLRQRASERARRRTEQHTPARACARELAHATAADGHARDRAAGRRVAITPSLAGKRQAQSCVHKVFERIRSHTVAWCGLLPIRDLSRYRSISQVRCDRHDTWTGRHDAHGVVAHREQRDDRDALAGHALIPRIEPFGCSLTPSRPRVDRSTAGPRHLDDASGSRSSGSCGRWTRPLRVPVDFRSSGGVYWDWAKVAGPRAGRSCVRVRT